MGDTQTHRADWRGLLEEHSQRHGPMYCRIAYGVLRDTEAAQDVCQEALLKAWRQRDQIRDAGALKSWLAKVTVSESLRLLRRRVTERRVLREHEAAAPGVAGPTEIVDRRDLALVALEQLEEPTRTVVILRVMEAMSGNDVSELLQVSPSEVSRRLHEGLDRLRRFLVNRQIHG
ncbi:MAG: sigma-70 family RNA polymerase sigma factor [Pirellulales bacterium]|nr:sigma-70 family RNA polymerase sigma factor [Pirellulales bacterium]